MALISSQHDMSICYVLCNNRRCKVSLHFFRNEQVYATGLIFKCAAMLLNLYASKLIFMYVWNWLLCKIRGWDSGWYTKSTSWESFPIKTQQQIFADSCWCTKITEIGHTAAHSTAQRNTTAAKYKILSARVMEKYLQLGTVEMALHPILRKLLSF